MTISAETDLPPLHKASYRNRTICACNSNRSNYRAPEHLRTAPTAEANSSSKTAQELQIRPAACKMLVIYAMLNVILEE